MRYVLDSRNLRMRVVGTVQVLPNHLGIATGLQSSAAQLVLPVLVVVGVGSPSAKSLVRRETSKFGSGCENRFNDKGS